MEGFLDFKKLQSEWYEKLKKTGFKDIEDPRYPKRPETRTLLFKNNDKVLYFYLRLDSFLTNNEIPQKDRAILTMYSDGIKISQISKSVDLKYENVRAIIRKYRLTVLKD